MRLIAFLSLPLLAQTPDRATAERGQNQFKSSCGFCHGEDATGNRAPDLIRSASLSRDIDGDLLAPIIRNGRPEKGMPAFSNLTERQIADIVAFLHARAEEAMHSNSVPRDYPLAKLLTGSAEEGKKFFNGAGGCSGCHSPAGDLRGVAAKYSPLELQQRFLYPSKDADKTATVKDGSKTFQGKLVHVDEFEIGIIAQDGWYRSWPRARVQVEIHDPIAAHRALMPKYTDRDIHNVFAYLETLQ